MRKFRKRRAVLVKGKRAEIKIKCIKKMQIIAHSETSTKKYTRQTDNSFYVSDVLRDFVPFLKFKKREKHPWRSVNTIPWLSCTFL